MNGSFHFTSNHAKLVVFIVLFCRCSFTFDPDHFPNPKAYLTEIKAMYGVKICLWSQKVFILFYAY